MEGTQYYVLDDDPGEVPATQPARAAVSCAARWQPSGLRAVRVSPRCACSVERGEADVVEFLDNLLPLDVEQEIEVPTISLPDRVMPRRVLGDVQSGEQLVFVPVPSRDRIRVRRVMRFASRVQYEELSTTWT